MRFKWYSISEVTDEIAMGPFGSNIKVDCFIDQGIPVLNGSNLTGIRLGEEKFRYVSEEKADSLGKANAYKGDVVVTHRGTLGQVSFIPKSSKYSRYVISQSQFRIRLRESAVRPDYFTYYFHSRQGQHDILSNTSQVGVPALARPTTTFQNLMIPVPKLDEQKAIAATLSCLDDKIELNNKICANLEAQAQALFKSWFVDFEPFQDGNFIESELGLIPEGWKIVELGKLMSFINGYAFKSASYSDRGDYKVITIKNVQDGKIDSSSASRIESIPEDIREEIVLKTGDTLMSLTGNVGRVGIVFENNTLLNQRVAKIKPKVSAQLPFFYILFRSSGMKKHLIRTAKGTAQANLSTIDTLKVEIPFNERQVCEFASLVAPSFESLIVLMQQSKALASLRDTLLPKLMSGEIEVPVLEEDKAGD